MMGLRQFLGHEQWTGGLRALWKSPVIVLMYHDLRAPGEVSSWLRVPVTAFEEHLRALRRVGRFLDPDALERHEGKGLAFLLTFDDGFVNNYRLALPLLEMYGVPALFFVSTWHLQTQEPFWFDRIVYPIQTSRLTAVDLRAAGLGHHRLPEEDGPRRWDGIQAILEEVKRGEPEVMEDVTREIGRQAGNAYDREIRHGCRPLRPEEVRRMQVNGLCRFGSHSHRHELLTRLDDTALTENLMESKRIIEEVTGRETATIAYPNGDCDSRVVARCRGAGYRRGYLVRPGVVTPETEPMAVCRLGVGGYDTVPDLLFKINRVLATGRFGRQHGNWRSA